LYEHWKQKAKLLTSYPDLFRK